MNCFTYTTTKKRLKEIRKEGVFNVPIFLTQTPPVEGDRISFNNFKDTFLVEKVTPKGGTIPDDAYFDGYYDLALRQLAEGVTIDSLWTVCEERRYSEFYFVAGDAERLFRQFEVELAVSESECLGQEIEQLAIEVEDKAADDFLHEILPKIGWPTDDDDEQLPGARHDVFVAYLDEYAPIAMMVFCREYNAELEDVAEHIPATYIDLEQAEEYGLDTEDSKYIVESLFSEAMRDCDPESIVALTDEPVIVIPKSQVEFYINLIMDNDWQSGKYFDSVDLADQEAAEEALQKITKEHPFGCVVFN